MERKAIAVAAALGALLALLIGLTAPSGSCPGPGGADPVADPNADRIRRANALGRATLARAAFARAAFARAGDAAPDPRARAGPWCSRPGHQQERRLRGAAGRPADLHNNCRQHRRRRGQRCCRHRRAAGMLSVYNATTTRGVIAVSGQSLSVEIGRMEPGEEVGVGSGAGQRRSPTGGYTNTASVVTSSPEQNTGNNTAQASFNVVMQPTALSRRRPPRPPRRPPRPPRRPRCLRPPCLPPRRRRLLPPRRDLYPCRPRSCRMPARRCVTHLGCCCRWR